MSSTRQAVIRGPSLSGCGKRPLLTPAHHVDLLTGIGPTGPMIDDSRTRPLLGRLAVAVSETVLLIADPLAIWSAKLGRRSHTRPRRLRRSGIKNARIVIPLETESMGSAWQFCGKQKFQEQYQRTCGLRRGFKRRRASPDTSIIRRTNRAKVSSLGVSWPNVVASER